MMTQFQEFIEMYQDGNEVFLATDDKNNIWLRATEVCKKLEFSDAHRTVKTYLKNHQYQELRLGMGRPALYISESGFYKLILKSKSLIAENFIEWLSEDILPKLRSQGLVTTRISDESLADYEARNSFLTSENQKLLGENKRVTQINKECSELDAKLAFIILAVVDGVCEQMSQFDLSLMTSKKYKKYKVYFEALHELQAVLEDIMPYNVLSHKSELTKTLAVENINRLFDTVALKKLDMTWEVNFKDWHKANLSEN